MSTKCPRCGNNYKSIGLHWSSCGYPNISDYQKQISIGCLMGDASIEGKGQANPRFTLSNTNSEYASFVNKKLQPFSSLNIYPNEKYKDTHLVRFTHPWLKNLLKWYQSGEKVFPDDIKLTPTILKHWYCCDGHFEKHHKRFTIGVENEKNNKQKLTNYFSNIDIDVSLSAGQIYATKSETTKILEYMGEPPTGFEYKWDK